MPLLTGPEGRRYQEPFKAAVPLPPKLSTMAKVAALEQTLMLRLMPALNGGTTATVTVLLSSPQGGTPLTW